MNTQTPKSQKISLDAKQGDIEELEEISDSELATVVGGQGLLGGGLGSGVTTLLRGVDYGLTGNG